MVAVDDEANGDVDDADECDDRHTKLSALARYSLSRHRQLQGHLYPSRKN